MEPGSAGGPGRPGDWPEGERQVSSGKVVASYNSLFLMFG